LLVCCFNHTLQLSAKALLHPFNTVLDKVADSDEGLEDADAIFDDDDDESDDNETKEGDGLLNISDEDDSDNEVDELKELDEEMHKQLIVDMETVHQTVSKVFVLAILMILFSY
jgi:hypothetical protein